MATHKMPRKAYEKAMKTAPPKHMRVSGDKGTSRRKYVDFDKFDAKCKALGIDFMEVMAIALADDGVGSLDKANLAVKILEHRHAKPKAVELTGDEGGPIELTISWAKPQDK